MLSEQNLLLEQVYPGGRSKVSVTLPAPKAEYPIRVFSEALLEDSSTRQRRSPMDWAISFLAHFVILVLLLFVPLYFSQGIDMKRLETTLLVAPMPPMAPAPPPPVAAIPRAVHVTPKVITPGKITAPTFIPKAVPAASTDAAPPEESFNSPHGRRARRTAGRANWRYHGRNARRRGPRRGRFL